MRRTLRQLASVKPARYLEAGTPTGLTGLYTASTPRATLLYLYSTTLDKLKAFPEHSVYRQSVEALTKHRMSLVQSVKPAGYDEWAARTIKKLKEKPDQLSAAKAVQLESGGDTFVIRRQDQPSDMRDREWDGDKAEEWDGESGHTGEGKGKDPMEQMKLAAELEEEPLLTAEQYVPPAAGRQWLLGQAVDMLTWNLLQGLGARAQDRCRPY